MFPDKIYYEPNALSYELGKSLKEKYADKPWIPIQSHNNIDELRKNQNKEFSRMKQHLIVGIRKTHKFVPNCKVSDYLVPFTSSGCSAICLYCYLVCNYNKCSYLRVFVNREQMMHKIIKTANLSENELTFEIGSNSDLILENTVTDNLSWTVETFAKNGRGFLTFPTKFDMVDPIIPLEHKGRVIFRMSVNPQRIINRVEFGTSPLKNRITALNKVCEADYKAGLLIAPIVLTENWKEDYTKLFEQLADELTEKTKKQIFIEIIFMTYSYIHRAINNEAFPKAVELYDKEKMTVRGRGKYTYKTNVREECEAFLRGLIVAKLPGVPILYVV